MSNSAKPRTFTGLACLWLAGAILVGVGFATAASTWVFELAPNDLLRTKVLLDALNDDEQRPRFAVLGNSVVMSGIDTQQLSKALELDEPGYNLATTGQNPVDSFLYYQEMPESIELIIQFTTPRFALGTDSIELQKYNAMYMYGYRPNPATKAELTALFGDEAARILEMSGLGQRFLSRWAIKQALDNQIRKIFRDDINLEATTYDLYSPNNGAERFTGALMDRAILRRYPDRDGELEFNPNELKARFYINAKNYAAKKNIKYVLVISPLHPRVHELYGERWFEQVRSFFKNTAAQGQFPVIDATDAMADEYFVDAVHFSEAGAVVLTEFIAAEIQRLGLTPGT